MPSQRKGIKKTRLGIWISSKSEGDFKIPHIKVTEAAEMTVNYQPVNLNPTPSKT